MLSLMGVRSPSLVLFSLSEGWGGVMPVCVVSLASMSRWKVQLSIYCARLIPVHLRSTPCSIRLYLIDICFLTCICLWQISQIQTCLRVVVGPGLLSTSAAAKPALMYITFDRYTRWPEEISTYISRFGIALDMISDRGLQFTSSLWSSVSSKPMHRVASHHFVPCTI